MPGQESKNELSDAAWVAASQRGDTSAFNRLVLKWEKPVYNLVLRMLQDPEDAAETTQEVFMRAYRAIGSFRNDSSFSTWLYRIAANHCLTRLKKRGAQPSCSLDDQDVRTVIQHRMPRQESHEHEFLQQDAGQRVREALALLSPEQRLVLELKFFQDMTFEEIADFVQAPLSTVKSRLYDGLGVLKNHFGRQKQGVQTKV
ncbi:MAG TPA: sigma-70 family RNA polymerase sigma factor [Acidobacteriota bacterium]|nr:sigma-70 family RNA polymerase sigma factor [Acidobacteriota bacterium]